MQASVKIQSIAYIMLAVFILTVPISWLFAAAFAACIHELCHIIVIFLCGGTVYSVSIGAFGAKIHTSPLTKGREFFCTLAGPCGSLILVCFARWIPRIALCGLIQGLFNLLPIYPMDGGRVFRCIVAWIRWVIGKIPCKDAKLRVQ